MMSLTALFTALGVEVMSHSEESCELHRLVDSHPLPGIHCAPFTPPQAFEDTQEKKYVMTSSRGSNSDNRNIGFSCVTFCFFE